MLIMFAINDGLLVSPLVPLQLAMYNWLCGGRGGCCFTNDHGFVRHAHSLECPQGRKEDEKCQKD